MAARDTTVADPFLRIIRAFGDVALALSDESDLDVLLHLIADRICELLGVLRCSIHLVDGRTGLLHGQIGRAGTNIDARVKRVIGGIPADGLTSEILGTRRPVYVANALADPRAMRSAMREWNVRSLLGVPMVVRGQVIGILYVDDENERRTFSTAEQELAATFADLAGSAIVQARRTRELRTVLANVERQNELLRRTIAIEARMTDLVLRGSSLRDVGNTVTELIGKPCAIYDASFHCLALSRPDGAPNDLVPRLFDEDVRRTRVVTELLEGLRHNTGTVVAPLPSLGLHHRSLVAPVMVDDERWGYVVITEYATRFREIDRAVATRAARGIALDMGARRRAARAEWDSTESLAKALLEGQEDRRSLEKRLELLGIRLERRRALVLIERRAGSLVAVPKARALAEVLEAESPEDRVLVTSWGPGLAVIVDLPDDTVALASTDWAAKRIRAALDEVAPTGDLLASVSAVRRGIESFPQAVADARNTMLCMQAHLTASGNQVLTADSLGGGRLFLASTDAAEARRFADDALSELTDPDDENMRELLLTLRVFIDCARSVRRSAELLGVHENTIRYRTRRIEEITGLALATDADSQLTAQLALLVLRLNGRLPTVAVPGVLAA